MPFSQSFTIAQTPLNPALVIATDNSTGSDVAITQRRIYVQDSAGNYLVPSGTTTDYTQWAYADSSLTLNILTQDTAVAVRVDWLNVSNSVLYTSSQNYCLSQFNQQFLYYLIQLQSLTYPVIQDTNYWSNIGTFWSNIIGAIKAVEIGDDIASSQACLNRSTFMQQQQNIYF